jgi:hypothetical protein
MWTTSRDLLATSVAFVVLACAGAAPPAPSRLPVHSGARLSVELDIRDEAGLHLVQLGVGDVGIELEAHPGHTVHRFVLAPGEHAVWMQIERGFGHGLVCGGTLYRTTRRVTLEPDGSLRICAMVDSTRAAPSLVTLDGIVSLDLAVHGACAMR